MVYRLGWEGFYSKRVREDFDWPARGAILARNCLRRLRFGLHSAKYVYKISVGKDTKDSSTTGKIQVGAMQAVGRVVGL